MKLIWTTDIHLNFCHQKKIESFCKKITDENPDALVITGDISEAPQLIDHLGFVDLLIQSVNPIPIFFVCGNHDYYHGSIVETRENLRKLFTYPEEFKNNLVPKLGWLGSSGIIPLTGNTALIGADGWYDGGYADWFKSDIQLNDYLLILELGRLCPDRHWRFKQLNDLAKDSAEYVNLHLNDALKNFEHVFVATHVPPFIENSVYDGKVSDTNWLPHFSSKHMGDVLLKKAEQYPNKQITVLCGHSHGKADNKITSNLRCITGDARYKHPKVNKIFEID